MHHCPTRSVPDNLVFAKYLQGSLKNYGRWLLNMAIHELLLSATQFLFSIVHVLFTDKWKCVRESIYFAQLFIARMIVAMHNTETRVYRVRKYERQLKKPEDRWNHSWWQLRIVMWGVFVEVVFLIVVFLITWPRYWVGCEGETGIQYGIYLICEVFMALQNGYQVNLLSPRLIPSFALFLALLVRLSTTGFKELSCLSTMSYLSPGVIALNAIYHRYLRGETGGLTSLLSFLPDLLNSLEGQDGPLRQLIRACEFVFVRLREQLASIRKGGILLPSALSLVLVVYAVASGNLPWHYFLISCLSCLPILVGAFVSTPLRCARSFGRLRYLAIMYDNHSTFTILSIQPRWFPFLHFQIESTGSEGLDLHSSSVSYPTWLSAEKSEELDIALAFSLTYPTRTGDQIAGRVSYYPGDERLHVYTGRFITSNKPYRSGQLILWAPAMHTQNNAEAEFRAITSKISTSGIRAEPLISSSSSSSL